MFVINNIEDQLSFFLFAKVTDNLVNGFPYYYLLRTFLNPLSSSEPFTFLLSVFMKSLFGTYYFTILIIFTLILNLFFSYLFFRKYKFGILYTLIFGFSSYFWLHIGTHMSLFQLWLYPAFLLLNDYFNKYKDKYAFSALLLIVFLPFSVFVSNYIGFFILLCFIMISVLNIFFSYIFEKTIDKRYILSFFVILFVSSFLTNYMKNSFVESRAEANLPAPFRTLEDFFYFSSRPWYFLIPSPKHAFYGDFSSNVLYKIESTGSFLTDDYFSGEHGASFFGYFLLLTFVGASGYIVFKGSREQKIYLSKYWLINIGLFLLMMPPYFTISGLKIYTPGYLVYEFFPMFRTTVRMSVLILLNILIVLAMFFNDLYLKFGDNVKKRVYLMGFILLLTCITLFETFIPIKVQYLNNSPEVYTYIGDTYSGSNFIVYPYSRSTEAVFWVDAHKSYLVNPRMYSKGDYDAELFTKSLNTTQGIQLLADTSGKVLPVDRIDYLVVFKDITEEEKTVFLNLSSILLLEKEFEDAYLFRVLNN